MSTKKKQTKISPKLVKYLEKAGVKHEILEHRTVYSAIDAAATMKKKLDEIVKSLLIKADKDYYLVLIPADNNLDLEKLKNVISKKKQKEIKVIKIPGEKMVENSLKVKATTISAFGKLHDLAVVADKKIEKLKKAVLASGSHNHSILMSVKDFLKLEEPIIGSFTVKKKIKKAKKAVAKKVITKKKPTTKKKIAVKKKPVVKKKK